MGPSPASLAAKGPAASAGGMGSTPGQGTKILQAAWCLQKKEWLWRSSGFKVYMGEGTSQKDTK